jgi:quercetin dioxygenase-like cupin family protein
VQRWRAGRPGASAHRHHRNTDGRQLRDGRWRLEPGQAQKTHAHADATKFYFVVEGRVRATLGPETREIGPGEMCWSAPGEPHGVENASNARAVLLVAMGPNPNR